MCRRPTLTTRNGWYGMWAGPFYAGDDGEWPDRAHLLPPEFERLWVFRQGGPWHKTPEEVVAGAAAWFDGLAPETRERLWEAAPAARARLMACEIAAL